MDMQRRDVDMGFAKGRFPEGTHMCLIYDDDEERGRIIGQFLAKGISLGERVVYFTDTTTPEGVETWLRDADTALAGNDVNGSFEVSEAADVYYPGGRFDVAEMIARLCDCYDQAVKDGYSGARGSGEMSWALGGIPGSDRFLEYEALINTISVKYPITPICQYDARRFDGATLLNVLKVHPLMIVKGNIVHNPYYISPEEFMEGFAPEHS